MENSPFWWCLPGKMGIFMGFVSLPEGRFYHNFHLETNYQSFRCNVLSFCLFEKTTRETYFYTTFQVKVGRFIFEQSKEPHQKIACFFFWFTGCISHHLVSWVLGFNQAWNEFPQILAHPQQQRSTPFFFFAVFFFCEVKRKHSKLRKWKFPFATTMQGC